MMDMKILEYGPNGPTQTVEGVVELQRTRDKLILITENATYDFESDSMVLEATT